ncbi:MAG: hypothetical protein ACPGD5_05690 [Salibacteraceae bacterium]
MNIKNTMIPYRVTLLISFIIFLTTTGISQKKKKNPYDDYWKQQEQEEKFDALIIVAHELFQVGELEKSKKKYQEALPFKPNDQETIAKIKDISILLEKRSNSIPAPQVSHQHTEIIEKTPKGLPPDSIIAQPNQTIDKRTVETTKNSVQYEDTAKQELTSTAKETQKLDVKNISFDQPKPQVASKTIDKTNNNYRNILGSQYPEGWTEEIKAEKNKTSTKRVFVKGSVGDEYLMVKHHYGAIYYFKNGKSISYSTWSAETSTFK